MTDLVVIMDKSGSMESIKKDVIGSFNSLIEEQKKLPGDARLTLVLFNNKVEKVYEFVDLREVENLTDEKYTTSGLTALHDAIGSTIKGLKEASEGDRRPRKIIIDGVEKEKVIVAIITDGFENASTKYKREDIFDMIGEQRAIGWDVLFLAANQDAIVEGEKLNISPMSAYNYTTTTEGVKLMSSNISGRFTSYRSNNE